MKDSIVLTDHAKVRCKQARISESLLITEASKIPVLESMIGEIRWRSRLGIMVIQKSGNGKFVIKTFISRKKFKNKKNSLARSFF